jgi:hypothetical protein
LENIRRNLYFLTFKIKTGLPAQILEKSDDFFKKVLTKKKCDEISAKSNMPESPELKPYFSMLRQVSLEVSCNLCRMLYSQVEGSDFGGGFK